MAHRWDPEQYLAYSDERGRPFFDLVRRVRAENPRAVVDLGCGPGNLTVDLPEIWPSAKITGIDNSPEMIDAAPRDAGVAFEVGDLREWAQEPPQVDVLLSNATLQWVPEHLELLGRLADKVTPGGWLAFQVPGNFAGPSHTLRTELAAEPRFAPHVADVPVPSSYDPVDYHRRLAGFGFEVDAWETTYLHVLRGGPDAVFEWVRGTGARPTLQALPDDGTREAFEAELRRRLRTAYPQEKVGVLLPFRRIFVVAHKEA